MSEGEEEQKTAGKRRRHLTEDSTLVKIANICRLSLSNRKLFRPHPKPPVLARSSAPAMIAAEARASAAGCHGTCTQIHTPRHGRVSSEPQSPCYYERITSNLKDPYAYGEEEKSVHFCDLVDGSALNQTQNNMDGYDVRAWRQGRFSPNDPTHTTSYLHGR